MIQFSKTIDASPEFAVAHWGLAQALLATGNNDRAIDELQRALELSGNSAYMRAHLALGLAKAGNRERALGIQRERERESLERYQSPYHEALIALGLNDRERMMRALERAFADRSGWMVFLPVNPSSRRANDARIQRLLARVKLMP